MNLCPTMCKLITSDPISEYVEARRYKNKLQDLQIQDDYLVLIPLDLAVLPKTETNQVLARRYVENDQVLGKAILGWYKFVRDEYLTITRKENETVQRFNCAYSPTG